MAVGSDGQKTVCLGTIKMEDVRPVQELVPKGTRVIFDVEGIEDGDLDKCLHVLTVLTGRDPRDQSSSE